MDFSGVETEQDMAGFAFHRRRQSNDRPARPRRDTAAHDRGNINP
jgi:hypothetical protein